MRFLLPLVLIAVAIGGFILITKPIYAEITNLQTEADAYGKALDNSAALKAERDRLADKFKSFKTEDLDRLMKMLPDSVDNIQLILEIQEEAAKRGIIVKNVEFEPEQFVDQTKTTVVPDNSAAPTSSTPASSLKPATRRAATEEDNKPYETFELEFSVEGAYKDFVQFMQLMERSLRLVDINSISFTPGTSEKDKLYSDQYRYLFRINTYRLRD